MTNKPILRTPGEMLANARQGRSETFAVVSERTKIPHDILEALERDEYHKVSETLYVKSFLRTYAKDMGLDEEQLLNLYREFSGELTADGSGDSDNVWVEDVKVNRVGLPWMQIGIGAAVVVVVLAFIFFMRGRWTSDPTETHALPEVTVDTTSTQVVAQTPSSDADPDTAAVVPVVTENTAADNTEVLADAPEAEPEPTPEIDPDRSHLPTVLSDYTDVAFRDGEIYTLVLQTICNDAVNMSVITDDNEQYRHTQWPADMETIRPLPASGVTAGRPYAVQQGYVTYWGANERFALFLAGTEGVRLFLNDEAQDMSTIRVGQQVVITAPESDVEPE